LCFWEAQCKASNSLYNSALYEYKQQHYQYLESQNAFTTYWRGDELRPGWKLRKITVTNRYQVEKLLNSSEHFKIMAAQSAQQTIASVQEAVNSFNELVGLFFER